MSDFSGSIVSQEAIIEAYCYLNVQGGKMSIMNPSVHKKPTTKLKEVVYRKGSVGRSQELFIYQWYNKIKWTVPTATF